MASTDAIPVPRKNTAYRFYFAIRKPSDSTLITTWAGQDSEVSLDGAAYSDCTNEATEIGTSGTGYIDLTSSEMNADNVLLKVTVTNTGAVPLVFALYPESAGDYRVSDTQKVDVETIKTNPVVNGGTITFPTGATLASTTNITGGTIANVTTVNGLAAGVITEASIANNAITDAKVASDVTIASVTGAVGSVTGLTASNLDAAVSSRASQTSVDDIPTNAELATALAAADDAVLAAIAALNNLSQSNIRTALGLASANLDTQLGELPTNAELTTALGTADDAVLAAIAALNNISSANVLTQVNAALDTAIAELSAGVPTATPTIRTALMLPYMALRNRTTTTATAQTIQNDAGTTIATATLSDDGTTMTKAEFA